MARDYTLLRGAMSRGQAWKSALIAVVSFTLVFLLLTPSLIDIPLPSIKSKAPMTTSILRANQSLNDIILASPSGQYRLKLQGSGSLVLLDQKDNRTLFSTDTSLFFDVTWCVVLRIDGVLELSWDHPSGSPTRGVVWQSNLLSECRASQQPGDNDQSSPPFLELLDNGHLQIRTAQDHICTISRPVDDKGRLAIAYTGSLRSYLKTCESHMEKIILQWTGSGGVDLHFFTYDEDVFYDGTEFEGEKVTYESVHRHLKACYGKHLKTLTINPVSISARPFPALPPFADPCGSTLGRMFSAFYALYLTGQQIQKYMLQNAIYYDYILRFRPDLLIQGESPRLQAVEHGKVINIRAAYDYMYWGQHHDGSIQSGFTDIAGYGRASTMWTYFNIHTGIVAMLSSEPTWDWAGIFDAPHAPTNIMALDRCGPEGILGYWLTMNGLQIETDWRWHLGILRRDGHLSQGFATCQPWLEPTWMCPEET